MVPPPPQPTTLAAAFASGRNRFDVIRLLAALTVLASHAWTLTGRADQEPIALLLRHSIDGGALAVATFFVLSGFLIARSAQTHPWRYYLRARALRLYPAFVVAILLQTLLLGPLASSLPAAAYLSHPATWSALARALLFSPPPGLPGVFETNPLPNQVNGSLWTLRVEVLCYAGLLLLHGIGLLRPRTIALPLAVGWALLAVVAAAHAGALPRELGTLRVASIVDCVLHFLMGAALWCWRDRIVLHWTWAAAAAVAAVAALGTPWAPAALHLTLPYLVLCAGFVALSTKNPLSRLGDVSYGTYLAAFPIEQGVVAYMGSGLGPFGLIAIAAPPALAYGLLSRRLIESPALKWRHAA